MGKNIKISFVYCKFERLVFILIEVHDIIFFHELKIFPSKIFNKDTKLVQLFTTKKIWQYKKSLFAVAVAAEAATPAALQMGHPNTSAVISSQAPPFPTREDVAMATIYYAAAHERVFSDYKHRKRKTETSYLHSHSI